MREKQKSVIVTIQYIPLSDASNMRKVESFVSDICETFLDKLRKAEVMSLAVDNSDVVQLCPYV